MYILKLTMIATFVACVSMSNVAEAAEWTVDKAKSKLGFSVNTSLVLIDAAFGSYVTQILLDRQDLENAKIVAEIEVASLEVLSSKQSGDLTVAMLSPAWMSATAHPKATFTSTAVRSAGGNAYEMDGTLELHGFEKPVTIPFTLDVEGRTAHAVGEVELARTDFDIGQGSFASPDKVGVEVTVTFDFVATRRFMESRSQRPDFALLRARHVKRVEQINRAEQIDKAEHQEQANENCWQLPFGLNHVLVLISSGCG